MKDVEQRAAAKAFADNWAGKGYEKGDTHSFWISFLQDVIGLENAVSHIEFEKEVVIDGNTKFIDVYLPDTRVMVEQKSLDKNLNKTIVQSGGTKLTPFEQAKNYANNLPVNESPKWIITCNFGEFQIYNMNKPGEAPTKILLSELPKRYSEFGFLIDKKKDYLKHELEVSVKAGELVGKIYDAFLKLYPDKEDTKALHSLNVLCVRLVFCLYAEDAGIFGKRDMFHDYLNSFSRENMRMGLIELFKMLDTKPEERDPFANENLLEFPYVNGGLFSTKEDILIPQITDEICDLILDKASMGFNWSDISPTIFGAVFESTLNPETRRSGGMHYTSIENIHKVIDPLFLDELKEELYEIKQIKVLKTKEIKLKAFQDKLASISWLDPATGSGNFLTETYLCIRRLENDVLLELSKGQIMFGSELFNPIKVSIQQFYGIEINDFAVTVAKTAMWIAESQMLKETENIVHMQIDFLPLKAYVNIVEGNALRMDWNDVVPANELNYIMGNPPFVGAMMSKGNQRDDILESFPECSRPGEVDYVTGWYIKAAKYIQDSNICCAFVSTNSICQGQQVALLWKPMFEQFHTKIDFAYRTFVWDSEAIAKAHVHCVIIGFSEKKTDRKKEPRIYNSNDYISADNINGYLSPGKNVYVESISKPLCNVPAIRFGSMPRDGGGFIFSADEYKAFVSKYPKDAKYLRPYLGAQEFLHNNERYCLWLLNADPSVIKSNPEIMRRVQYVKETREKSKAAGTRKFAATPTLFCQIAQPSNGNYIAVPKTSSERRRYIPMGFLSFETIASDLLFLIPDAELYEFGILQSNVHMAWVRLTAGRLKSDYRYAKDLVYNTFPWPDCSKARRLNIEQTAQRILDARALYPDSSLADLYDPLSMPTELINAHRANDKAVWEAYGKAWDITSEPDCVAFLMTEYQRLIEEKN